MPAMADRVRVYTGTYDGVQVLSVQGDRCDQVAHNFGGAIIGALAGCRQRPERVFAGMGDGLYRTDDAGTSWSKMLDGDIRSAAVDPTDDAVIYAGTDPVHLYRSEDGGDTWEELESLQRLPEETHRQLGEHEKSDLPSHDPRFRHRRQDWWFPVPPHKGHVLETFVHPDDPNLIFLSIEHGGVARSADRGQTWEDVSDGIDYLDIHFVATLPHRFDRWFVSSARGLYTSPDPREGWERAQNGCDRNYFHDILTLPPANGSDPVLVIATADGSPGFWPATKGKDYWDHSVTGSRAALFQSTDSGESWQRLGTEGGLPEEMDPMIWSLCSHPFDRSGIFAGVGESSGVPSPSRKAGSGSVLFSGDGGHNWRTLKDGLPAVEHVFAAAE